jgi:hypothetical protein
MGKIQPAGLFTAGYFPSPEGIPSFLLHSTQYGLFLVQKATVVLGVAVDGYDVRGTDDLVFLEAVGVEDPYHMFFLELTRFSDVLEYGIEWISE